MTAEDHDRLSSQAVSNYEKEKQTCIKRGDVDGHQRVQFMIDETKRMAYENIKALEERQSDS